MITAKDLREAGFMEDKIGINGQSPIDIWSNFKHKTGIILIPNGQGVFIPYIQATITTDSLDSLIPCVQISTVEELKEDMDWIKRKG